MIVYWGYIGIMGVEGYIGMIVYWGYIGITEDENYCNGVQGLGFEG